MRRINIIALLLVPLLFTLTGSTIAQKNKLKVVTTLNYLKYIAQKIGGDHAIVEALSNPKQDPHYVTPTPRMNQTANEADLMIESGLNLDLWAKNVVDASGNPGIQRGAQGHLVATVNVPIKELPTEVSRAWGDIHPQGNPHVWLDPLNAETIAENMANRFSALDPLHADAYRKNLEAFRTHLNEMMFGRELLQAIGKGAGDILARKARNDELYDWLEKKLLLPKLSGWMGRARKIRDLRVITYHKTYIYFADRFGLKLAGELEDKPGIPPPPQRRDEVVEQMNREGIRIILNDNFYSRDAADYVASKTQARVLITYLDVGAEEQVDTYEKLVSYLLESLIEASEEKSNRE